MQYFLILFFYALFYVALCGWLGLLQSRMKKLKELNLVLYLFSHFCFFVFSLIFVLMSLYPIMFVLDDRLTISKDIKAAVSLVMMVVGMLVFVAGSKHQNRQTAKGVESKSDS